MRKLLLTFSCILLTSLSFAQVFSRQANENAESFVKRVLNVDELTHDVIETKEWDSTKKVIIAFKLINSQSQDHYDQNKLMLLVGYCFFPIGPETYQRSLIDTFYEDGGEPRIESVFFVNADRDKEREIAITVNTRQYHKAAGIYGYFYETYIYDNPDLLHPPPRLKLFKDLSSRFHCYEGSSSDGKDHTCKFKDVSSIRAALKKMGY